MLSTTGFPAASKMSGQPMTFMLTLILSLLLSSVSTATSGNQGESAVPLSAASLPQRFHTLGYSAEPFFGTPRDSLESMQLSQAELSNVDTGELNYELWYALSINAPGPTLFWTGPYSHCPHHLWHLSQPYWHGKAHPCHCFRRLLSSAGSPINWLLSKWECQVTTLKLYLSPYPCTTTACHLGTQGLGDTTYT